MLLAAWSLRQRHDERRDLTRWRKGELQQALMRIFSGGTAEAERKSFVGSGKIYCSRENAPLHRQDAGDQFDGSAAWSKVSKIVFERDHWNLGSKLGNRGCFEPIGKRLACSMSVELPEFLDG